MTASQAELATRYGVTVPYPPDLEIPPPELFPKRMAWTIREVAADRTAEPMSWGFPINVRGASGKQIKKSVTNVRNDASPFWRSALSDPAHRCLVPFTDFCEWEGETGAKVERWFDVPSQPITSFAGVWRPTEAGPVMAFLTCEPNPLVAAPVERARSPIRHRASKCCLPLRTETSAYFDKHRAPGLKLTSGVCSAALGTGTGQARAGPAAAAIWSS